MSSATTDKIKGATNEAFVLEWGVVMSYRSLILVAGLGVLAGACTTDGNSYGPYYGPSQGYAPQPGYVYYAPPPNYYPARYGAPYREYGGGSPSITFTFPQGTVP